MATKTKAKPQTDADDPILTRIEVCKLLRVSQTTFYAMLKAGQAPPGRRIGKQCRYLKSDVVAWLKNVSQTTGNY